MRSGFRYLFSDHLARPQPVWRGNYRLINRGYKVCLIEQTDVSIQYLDTDSVRWSFYDGTIVYHDGRGGNYRCDEKEYYVNDGNFSCLLNETEKLSVHIRGISCYIRNDMAICSYGSKGGRVKIRLHGTNYSQIVAEVVPIMTEIYNRHIKYE